MSITWVFMSRSPSSKTANRPHGPAPMMSTSVLIGSFTARITLATSILAAQRGVLEFTGAWLAHVPATWIPFHRSQYAQNVLAGAGTREKGRTEPAAVFPIESIAALNQ